MSEPMNAETTARYLEQLILAERDFAAAADVARMNLHQPLTREIMDRMQQHVDCALSRLGAAQDMNPPIVVEQVAAPPVVTPDGPTGTCCGGNQGCATEPATAPLAAPGKIGNHGDCGCGE